MTIVYLVHAYYSSDIIQCLIRYNAYLFYPDKAYIHLLNALVKQAYFSSAYKTWLN